MRCPWSVIEQLLAHRDDLGQIDREPVDPPVVDTPELRLHPSPSATTVPSG